MVRGCYYVLVLGLGALWARNRWVPDEPHPVLKPIAFLTPMWLNPMAIVDMLRQMTDSKS